MPVVCRVLVLLLVATPAFAQSPGPPENLTNTVSGNVVTLTWSPPASGGAPDSYVVEASVTPGGPLVATLPVPGTTLVVPDVPSGTYFVRVRAVNAAGSSAPSSETVVSVTGSGCPAPPLPPSLIVRSSGFDANVSWGPSGGCAPTSYVMSAGSAPGASDVAVVNAGGGLGLSAVAPPGVYYVRVVGTNAFGSAVSQELTLRVAANAQSDTVAPNGAVAFDVVMNQSGTYTASLVWDDPAVDLDLYLTTAGCPYPPTSCLLEISDASGTNSEAVSRTVVAGETYRLWIDNPVTPLASSFTIFNTFGGAPIMTDPAAQTAADGPSPPPVKQ